MNTLDNFLSRLKGVKRSGKQWAACCPAHDDKNQSLSIVEKEKILLHCFAGCTTDAVLKALGMTAKDLFTNSPKKKKIKPQIVAIYDYTDQDGALVYQNVRHEEKVFRLRRPDGHDGWIWNVPGSDRTIYNLPVIAGATDVLWVEGEKDGETAKSLGFTATTSGGSTSWQDRFAMYLEGKNVTIIADADEPGRKHARQVARAITGKAASVKVLELPGAKDLSVWVERGGTRDALIDIIKNTPAWSAQTIDLAELLTAIYSFIRRFVSLSEAQAVVLALWVAHTHAIDGADVTPYLAVTSAEKQSGKSRLLETLALIVANPWLTGRVTAAVLVRKVDDKKPTLLLDESDAAFGGEKEYAEALRGILNTGHRRGGVASLCVGKGAEISYKDFSTFCPKAIAGIGKLPDTVADRSIPIRLKRAARGEVVERFRLRNLTPVADVLRVKLEQWAECVADHLRDARPALPDELSDRQQDGTEPLLAIADLAGNGWPEIARAAVVELCIEARQSDDSIGARLLADIRQVFESRSVDRIASAELAEALATIETSPWGEWNHGKPITASKLARLLRPFEVTSRKIRIGDKTPWGYEPADFEDAFQRYLPPMSLNTTPKPEPPEQVNVHAGNREFFVPEQKPDVPVSKHAKSPMFMRVVPDVPDLPPIREHQGTGLPVKEVVL